MGTILRKMFRKIKRLTYQITHPIIGYVLEFHRVTAEKSIFTGNNQYEITPSSFENIIIDYHKKGYKFISVEELCQCLKYKKKIRKFVCITFDDGYKDIYEIAYPILKQYDSPFAVFVVNNHVNGKAKLWRYVIDDLICDNDIIELHDGTRICCKTVAEKEIAFTTICNLFNPLEENDIVELLSDYSIDWEAKTNALMMNEETLQLLANDNICTIGSHTVSHCQLSRLTKEKQMSELKDSKEYLHKLLHRDIRYFAYPYGDYSDGTANMANQIYAMTFAGWGGGVRWGDNQFDVKRVIIQEQ